MSESALKFFNSDVSISSCSSSLNVYHISAHSFCMQTQRKHFKHSTQVFTVSIININKTFKIKSYIDSQTKLSKQYHQYFNVFNRKKADKLSSLQNEEMNHDIELITNKNEKAQELL